MNEQTGEHRTSRRAAHWRRDERIREKSAALLENSSRFGHVLQRAEFHILVVRHHQDDIGLLGGRLA